MVVKQIYQDWSTGFKVENEWEKIDYDTRGDSTIITFDKKNMVILTSITQKNDSEFHYAVVLEKTDKRTTDQVKKLFVKNQSLECNYDKAITELENTVRSVMLKH